MIDVKTNQAKINSIINDDNYIMWLENFTTTYPKFYHDNLVPSEFKSCDDSKQNIQDISLLYNVIKNYAKNNYISPIPTVCGNYYSIKHNNIGYQIGIMTGPETIYYCMRTEEEKSYIPFKDIQNNAKTPTAILINNKMEELTQLISIMIDNNISCDIILGEAEKTLQKVLAKQKRT